MVYARDTQAPPTPTSQRMCAPKMGWEASLTLAFSSQKNEQGARTALSALSHTGPLRVQRPFYPEGKHGACHVYVLHPPGGVVAGDDMRIDCTVKSGAHALITTPGATKFYRSESQYAHVTQRLEIERDAVLEWFVQENIFFNGAKAKVNTHIRLHEGAKFMGWELHCLGRPANQERFLTGSLNASLRIDCEKNGKWSPLLMERLRIQSERDLRATSGMRDYAMQATFIATQCNAEIVEQVRACMEATLKNYSADVLFGASVLDDVLMIRALGHGTEALQNVLIPVWEQLRPRLLNVDAERPRIWAT